MSFALIKCNINFDRYKRILEGNSQEGLVTKLLELVKGFNDYKYFDMLPSGFKRKKQKLVCEIRKLRIPQFFYRRQHILNA